MGLTSNNAPATLIAAVPARPDGDVAATAGAIVEPITLINANAMRTAGDQFIAASPTVVVQLDMRAVEATSVAVAVTLAWLGGAARTGKELCLSNLSEDFSGVIEFSGINSMFAEHISGSRGELA